MLNTDHTWQALEIVRDPRASRPRHATALQTTLATIVHNAIWTYDCGPVTYLSLPGVTRQRTLLRAGTPSDRSPPPLAEVDTSDIAPGTQTLAALADQHTAGDIGLAIADVETAPVGQTSAYTQRLLAADASAPDSFSTTPPALAPVLDSVSSQPHAFSVVAERGSDDQIELAIRLVEFPPARQIYSRKRLAQTEPGSLSNVIDAHNLLTNWDLPARAGWTQRHEDRLATDRPLLRQSRHSRFTDTPTKQALAQTASFHEYSQLWPRVPADPLERVYTNCGATGRLTATTSQLPAVYPVVGRLYPTSVWEQVDGRAPIRITPVTTIAVPHGMSIAETDPTAHATRSTPVSEPTSTFEQAVRRWCLEHGETIASVETAPPGGAFLRTAADGTRTLAYLATTESLAPGRLLAAVWWAYHESTVAGVSVFAPSQARATAAATIIGRPFKPASPDALTELYRQPTTLSSGETVAVRPLELPPERWRLTPDNDLRCVIDGTVVARGALTAPLETFLKQVTRVTPTDEQITLTYPDGSTRTYESRDAVQDVAAPLRAPARPVHLAMGRESASVFAQDGPNFTGVRYPPTARALSNRDRQAIATAFWETYTVPDTTSTLQRQTIRPEIVSYARHQTDRPARPPGWVQLREQYGDTSSVFSSNVSISIEGRRLRYTPPARDDCE